MDTERVKIGATLRARREKLGLTQPELARAARVDLRQLRRYEHDEQQPSVDAAVRLARSLRFSIAELVGEGAGAQRLEALASLRALGIRYPPGYLKALRDEWPD